MICLGAADTPSGISPRPKVQISEGSTITVAFLPSGTSQSPYDAYQGNWVVRSGVSTAQASYQGMSNRDGTATLCVVPRSNLLVSSQGVQVNGGTEHRLTVGVPYAISHRPQSPAGLNYTWREVLDEGRGGLIVASRMMGQGEGFDARTVDLADSDDD